MKKIFVIDASGYLYSSYYAIRNMSNSKGESTNALFGFIRSVLKLIKDFQPTHMVAVFDGPRNGKKREEIYSEYKAHRKAAPQDLPPQIVRAQEFCSLMGVPYLNIAEVEADDTMGTIAVWSKKHGATAYLCTSDKDMAQLVDDHTLLLNTRKDNLIIGAKEVEEIYGVPPTQIVDLLAMTGDASDNVPGLPGVGPKTAISLLQQYGSLDEMLAHPEKIPAGKKRTVIEENKDKALLSRRLVTIDCGVNIPHDLDFYQLKEHEVGQLKSFYSDMNFNSLLKELELNKDIGQSQATHHGSTQKTVQGELPLFQDKYILVDDEKDLAELIVFLKKHKEVCFDTETTDLRPLQAELVGIGLGVSPHNAWYIPTNGKLGLQKVLEAVSPLFENPHIGFYGHNVKYDYHVLANYGIHVANLCFDTLLASYLLNSHNRQHSLDTLSLQYFGKVKIPTSDLIGKGKNAILMCDVPIDKVCTYCCEDVDFACRLKKILEGELRERQLEKLMFTVELPLLKVLAGMERHGIYLDIPTLKHTTAIVLKQTEKVAEEIYQMAGKEFNINSTKQLADILQHQLHIALPKKTATGFSTNADVLESLTDKHPIANLLLEYRTLEKLRSTYLDNLPNDVNPKTHRIHCTFNQSVAATGRLSCQDPNLQNIPVRTEVGREIRKAFRPQQEGWSYLSADYSQIELRLLAHFSEDPNMLNAFKHHEDIHVSTAAAILNISPDRVTKEQRHHAKAINFGIIYGQQAFGLAKELKIDVKSAASFIEAYFHRFSHVKEYLELCKERARKTGKAVTFIGRERSIPEINSKNPQLRTFAERLAVNTPLQGTAADLIKLAMLKIDQELHHLNLKSYMVLQIHDELIFEVPDDEINTLTPKVKEIMQGVFHLKVPLIVDITIGKNWKEC